MLTASRSITKRLIAAVLIVEIVAALALTAVEAAHERHVQYKAFDANLRGAANALFGAVQEDVARNVLLDVHGLNLPREAVFRVQEEGGHVLGAAGALPADAARVGAFEEAKVSGQSYRFYALRGDRVIDPFDHGGVHHPVTIVYGLPDGHVWHEVVEAVQFTAAAASLLLLSTALLLAWVIRRLTHPIHQLAEAAELVTVHEWNFLPPAEAREVTELQPLVAALESALARLHRSFDQQRRFTSDAAHELKTDLAIVKSSFQLLAMKERSNAEYQRGVAVGLCDIARLEGTVQNMLTLAQVEQPATDAAACRLDTVLEQAVQFALSTAQLKTVTLHLEATPATVPCDSRDAALLATNLLMNAIRHTRDASTVAVQCSVREETCVLQVRDDGPGVNESEVPLLFEPFYRGDASRNRATGSTGLGLSICKAICERAGGTIQIANGAVGGAVVTVELPLVAAGERFRQG